MIKVPAVLIPHNCSSLTIKSFCPIKAPLFRPKSNIISKNKTRADSLSFYQVAFVVLLLLISSSLLLILLLPSPLYTWKMPTVLNRIKNQFSDFWNFLKSLKWYYYYWFYQVHWIHWHLNLSILRCGVITIHFIKSSVDWVHWVSMRHQYWFWYLVYDTSACILVIHNLRIKSINRKRC